MFTAERARKGYHLNQFCMCLMKAENRERFKADERAYLDEWPMTEAQKQAVLARDFNALHRRRAATSTSWPRSSPPTARASSSDGRQHDRHDARKNTRDMMLEGGRSPEGTALDQGRKY